MHCSFVSVRNLAHVQRTIGFKVYKMDEESVVYKMDVEWIQLESLGDR